MKVSNPKLKRLLEIRAELEANKPLYAELDAIVVELSKKVKREYVVGGFLIEIVDNFATKNTCFRPAAVKRFDVKVTPVTKAKKKAGR